LKKEKKKIPYIHCVRGYTSATSYPQQQGSKTSAAQPIFTTILPILSSGTILTIFNP
jgi:hypothetical protein